MPLKLKALFVRARVREFQIQRKTPGRRLKLGKIKITSLYSSRELHIVIISYGLWLFLNTKQNKSAQGVWVGRCS